MAPRKSTKPAPAPEAGTLEAEPKARAKTPARKPAVASPELVAASAPATPKPAAAKAKATAAKAKAAAKAVEAEPAAPVDAPAKAARKPRTVKAAKPEPEPAAEPAAAAPAAEPAAAQPASALAGEALLPETARRVLEAIQAGAAVELLFQDAETNPPRTFEPRQLIFDTFTKAWFVWGWDRRYNAERHHRLDLIAQAGPVEGVGRAAQGPYKEGTPANHIGGWLGGEPIQVKAILLKQWIFAVRQAPAPFPDFKLEELEEGKAQVTFTGTDLRAIARWAMQFGDGIQVLEPQRLQDRIKQVGISWAGKAAVSERPAPPPPPAPKQQRQPERQSEPHHRPDHRPEHPAGERRKPEPPRHHAPESAKPAAKPSKFEIRIDRL